jgi:hypothetical protein
MRESPGGRIFGTTHGGQSSLFGNVQRGIFLGAHNPDRISKMQYSVELTHFSAYPFQIPGGKDVTVVPRINFFRIEILTIQRSSSPLYCNATQAACNVAIDSPI